MKRLPLGVQNFRKIAEGNYIYVDKSKYIYDLIEGASYYFLSRPRRFGKSLLLDTIGEVFLGNKELFKSLWIYDSDYAFEPHPVIRLDMSKISSKTPEELETSLLSKLRDLAEIEELVIRGNIPSDIFWILIERLHKKYNQRVVVLIDEYDKPMLDHLHNPDISVANREIMRGFYGILKSMDPYLKFTLITGVSKFTKTAIFSELNNLYDITLDDEFAGICGIPVEGLDKYFGQHIDRLKTQKVFSKFKSAENIRDEILAWYDGYSWDGENRLLNPFSLLSFFKRKRFESFWYSSGSPKFLIDMIKGKPESFLTLRNLTINESMLDSFDVYRMELEPLLFQTGYLTVKEVTFDNVMQQYEVGIPNFEVRNAFSLQVAAALTETGDAEAGRVHIEIRKALKSGDLDRILELLRALFASIPYQLHRKDEAYYHSIFHAVMTVLGFDVCSEVSTSRGILDAVLELEDKVYVMEFKYANCDSDASSEDKRILFDKELDEAMTQIAERGYSDKYIGCGKAICHAAFAFLGRDNIEMKSEWLTATQ